MIEKVKVNLLVKGNIIVTGDAKCHISKANLVGLGNKPIPDKYDLNDAAAIEGNLVVKGNIVLSNGVMAATGDIILLATEAPQSCDPHFLKGDETQPGDNGWHLANNGCVAGGVLTCDCPFWKKTPDGGVVAKGDFVVLKNDREHPDNANAVDHE